MNGNKGGTIMEIKEIPFALYRKPEGGQGKEIVDEMNESHYRLTTWGLENIHFTGSERILEIGCGGGRTAGRLAALAPNGSVTGVDYSQDCVIWAKEANAALVENGKLEIFQADIEKLPFDDAVFDKALAIETIYFWPDLGKNFKEAARVLKPGGEFIILCEAYNSDDSGSEYKEKNKQLSKYGNMKILSPDEAERLLKNAGFKKTEVFLRKEDNWICCIAHK